MADENDNKVVQFPTHRVKRSKTASDSTNVLPTGHIGGQTGQPPPVPKITFIVSLVATIFMATMLTNRLTRSQIEPSDRQIASVDRDIEADIELARKIARDSLREPASRGHMPTAEDLLRHGELAGFYSLRFSDAGALIGLEYSSPPGSERFIKDRVSFLKRNMDLLRIEYGEQKLSESIQDKDRLFEVYELKLDNAIKARVHFTLDAQDHLYSMKVEPN